jgi:hypothetical protein
MTGIAFEIHPTPLSSTQYHVDAGDVCIFNTVQRGDLV